MRKIVVGITLYTMRLSLGLSGVMLFALCSSLAAQQPAKLPRIGYLSAFNPTREFDRAQIIRLALRELGYVEGQNIEIEYGYAEGKQDRFRQLAAELVRRKVNIILVLGGDILIQAAKDTTKTIPIVMTGGGLDPVEAGLVESLARPGGNVTGLTNLSRKLGGKRLELLKEAVPKIARVAVVYDPASGSGREVKEVLPVAARALGLTVRSWEIRDAADFERIFAAISRERPDGLYVPARGPLINTNEKRIADFALESRLPSVYSYGAGVEAGGLMYYGADLADIYRRAASYVDKLLKGAKPADLPVEQPTKFELIINLKAAKKIGIAIPPNILARADRVIR
jgi:putative tryptophan/tyrosine transport system substrate-binding protein